MRLIICSNTANEKQLFFLKTLYFFLSCSNFNFNLCLKALVGDQTPLQCLSAYA